MKKHSLTLPVMTAQPSEQYRARLTVGESGRLLAAFLARDFRTETSYRIAFLLNLSGVFITTFTYYFISRLFGEQVAPALAEYGTDYFAFALVGAAFASYFNLGLNGFASALRESQTTGTLEAMMMTPVPVPLIILGSAAWSYAFTTVRVALYLFLGWLLGMELTHANYGVALVVFLVALVSFSSIGIIAAGIIMVIKRGDPLTSLMSSVATLLGGVLYPVEILPQWLQLISYLLPLTYALRAIRMALFQGASWQEVGPDLLILAAFALVLFPLSLFIFRYAVERTRADGSLTHY